MGVKLHVHLLEDAPEMPFSAQYVISHYVKIGKDNKKLYAGIVTESGVAFPQTSGASDIKMDISSHVETVCLLSKLNVKQQ